MADETTIYTEIEIEGCQCEDVKIRHSRLNGSPQELFENLQGFVRFGDELREDVYVEGRFNKYELLALALTLWQEEDS